MCRLVSFTDLKFATHTLFSIYRAFQEISNHEFLNHELLELWYRDKCYPYRNPRRTVARDLPHIKKWRKDIFVNHHESWNVAEMKKEEEEKYCYSWMWGRLMNVIFIRLLIFLTLKNCCSSRWGRLMNVLFIRFTDLPHLELLQKISKQRKAPEGPWLKISHHIKKWRKDIFGNHP